MDAVRRDLADVRLAGRVFAPHYAAPMSRTLALATLLRETAAADSAILAELAPGDAFDVLELATDTSWGVAPGKGMVGYIDTLALGEVTA